MIGRICILPLFRTTRNTKLQNFQFKLSHIITATTTFLFKRGLKETELCTFCTETKESLLHLFWECTYTKINWFSLVTIYVFTVFRLLTDFVCLYNYEFWLSLCKIVRSSEILLLPLLYVSYNFTFLMRVYFVFVARPIA